VIDDKQLIGGSCFMAGLWCSGYTMASALYLASPIYVVISFVALAAGPAIIWYLESQ